MKNYKQTNQFHCLVYSSYWKVPRRQKGSYRPSLLAQVEQVEEMQVEKETTEH